MKSHIKIGNSFHVCLLVISSVIYVLLFSLWAPINEKSKLNKLKLFTSNYKLTQKFTKNKYQESENRDTIGRLG